MFMDIDLHSHSTVSDGLLEPRDLVHYAVSRGVRVLALTDHDATAGLVESRLAAKELGLHLVDGVEISVTWRHRTIHIVGLRINADNPSLQAGLAMLRAKRHQRAVSISHALSRAGIADSLSGAYGLLGTGGAIGRLHFARFLVERGVVKDRQAAFKHYLGKGRLADVVVHWAGLEEAVGWIRASGGEAVLAHPARYALSRRQLLELLDDFKRVGGAAIEVVTGSHSPEHYKEFAQHAKRFNLRASRGSDYHGMGLSFTDMGTLPALPPDTVPIWKDWAELADFT